MQARKEKKITAASVKLRLWYNSTNLKHYEIRNIIGVSRQSLSYYMLGQNKPDAKVREAIDLLTKGRVSLKDWEMEI